MKSVSLYISLSLLLCGISLPVQALPEEQEELSQDPAAQLEPEQAAARAEMEEMVEEGFQIAIQAIGHRGNLYPFALVHTTAGQISTLAQDQDGERKPAEEFASDLVYILRANAKQEEINAAALVKLHQAATEEGEPVLGIWALVDHEDFAPWVAFLPLLQRDDGTFDLGKDEMAYYATDQWLFEPADK